MSVGSTRYAVEAAVVLLYTAWLALRLISTLATSPAMAVAAALLVGLMATVSVDVFTANTVKTRGQRAPVWVPLSSCRPMCDDGLSHGLLLVPLVIGAILVALPAQSAQSLHAEYLIYSFILSLTMSSMLWAHVALATPDRPRSLWIEVAILTFVQLATVAVWHWTQDLGLSTVIHTHVCLLGFQALLHVFMLGFPKSFSLGEAAIVAQLLVLLGGDALAATAFRFRIVSLPAFMNLSRTPIHLFLQSLILGMVMIGILLSPILVQLRKLASSPTPHAVGVQPLWMLAYSREAVAWSVAFILGVFVIVFMIISPWMRFFLHMDPFWWTFTFLTEGWRLHLVVYWALAIAISVTALSWIASRSLPRAPVANGHHAPTATTTSRLPLILVRKYFHLLAVGMFSPGLILEPYLLQLAFGVALSLLLLVEYIRLCDVYPLGKAVLHFMGSFVDHRDSGPLVLSHLYLLLGCAIPMWLTPAPPSSFFAPFSGIVTIGIGDTMASVVGISIGRIKWPQTTKTVEGTVAGILSSIVFSYILSFWCPHLLVLSASQIGLYIVALTLAGIMEAHTQQIDNLIVPLYLLASVLML